MKHTLLSLSLLATCACGAQKEGSVKPNVILICMDTVRADHLGSYGYGVRQTTPFLDSLAAKSLRFQSASATACWTKPSVPTIFTGLLPMQHGVYRGSAQDEAGSFTDVLPEAAWTLAEAFGAHGYQTAAFVRNSQLRRGIGFEQGFDLYRDQAGDAQEIRWRAGDWIDLRDRERPFFLYLHFLDAHWPYDVPESYASRWSDPEQVKRIRSGDWRAFRDAVNRGERPISAQEREALLALYDGSIRYIDDQLALLWAKLKREGLDESTVVCVTSDHGEEFMEHGKLGHGHGLYKNLLDVPWILHLPGKQATLHEAPVSLLDLYPTLLAAAGILGSAPSTPGINRLARPSMQHPALAEHLDPSHYELSWREGHHNLIDTVTPIPQERSSPDTLLDWGLRGRWEVRFTQSANGQLQATRMRPAKPEDATLTETELKGMVEKLGPKGFEIAGIQVGTEIAPEFYGHPSEPGAPELFEGQMVKVRGTLLDARLIARKIKRYGPSSEVETEIRGRISVQNETALRIDEVPLAFMDQTEVELRDARPDLGVQEVADLISGALKWQGRTVLEYRHDEDPQEVQGHAKERGLLDDPDKLERLRLLLRDHIWSGERGRNLTPEQLDDLSAIGY